MKEKLLLIAVAISALFLVSACSHNHGKCYGGGMHYSLSETALSTSSLEG